MQVSCPCCQTTFPIEAGLLDGDGKRLAQVLASAEPAFGRAIIGYLRLHKPAKTVLRMAKAARLAEEVIALAGAAEIRRGGLARPNNASYWAAGIEQMLDTRAKLRLPLTGHGYLMEVAFGLADSADAALERQTEAQARVGKHRDHGSEKTASTPVESPLQNALAYIAQQLHMGTMTPETAETERARVRAKFGVAHG